MKRILAMLLSVAMLVCYMPAMVWAEDEVAEPVVETETTDEPVVDDETTAEPISAQAGSAYGTRENPYVLEKTEYEPGRGNYDFDLYEPDVEQEGLSTIWAKFVIDDDDTQVKLHSNDSAVKSIQLYKGESSEVYKTLERGAEYEWEFSGHVRADAGDVFYIQIECYDYCGSFNMDVGYEPYTGFGTKEDPYLFEYELNDEEDPDSVAYYSACATYNDEEAWFKLVAQRDNAVQTIELPDWDGQIESVQVYKGSQDATPTDAVKTREDGCDYYYTRFKANAGDEIYIKVKAVDTIEYSFYLDIREEICNGSGTKEDPYKIEYITETDDDGYTHSRYEGRAICAGENEVWVTLTAANDDQMINLYSYDNSDEDTINKMEVFRAGEDQPFKSFDRVVDEDGWVSFESVLNAKKGDVFNIKVSLRSSSRGSIYFGGYEEENPGTGTIDDPYKYICNYDEDEDEYVFYNNIEGEPNYKRAEVWNVFTMSVDDLVLRLHVEDYRRTLSSVELYKNSTDNKIGTLKYDVSYDEYLGTIRGCSEGDKIYVKFNFKSSTSRYNNEIYLYTITDKSYGNGSQEKPYQVFYNFEDYMAKGDFQSSGNMEEFNVGDTWVKYNFEDAGWLVWLFMDDKNDSIDSISLYDADGNYIRELESYEDVSEGVPYHVFNDGAKGNAGDSYLLKITTSKNSSDGYMSLFNNELYADLLSSKRSYTYTGSAIKPSVVVFDGTAKKLVNGVDYTVKYSSNTSVGEAMIKVTPIGEYAGLDPAYTYFRILPKKTSLKKLYAGKKSFKVTWAKQAAKMKTSTISGYQIEYSTSSTFKSGNKFVKVKGYKSTSKTIKSLKAKKKYYVRIRTYKTKGCETYYSAWSTKKSIKTK